MAAQSSLPSLDQTLEHLRQVERRHSEAERAAQTKTAIEANERFVFDRTRVEQYLGHLDAKQMFSPIYDLGNMPQGLPVALPPYLIEIMDASARVLCALTRQQLAQGGPQYLTARMPQGWLSDEMAERLHAYFLAHEPDMGFDVLVCGQHSHRGMSFGEFKRSGDVLHAKILEAQSVDTYYGWIREFLRGARRAGFGEACQFTWSRDAHGRVLSDAELDAEVRATLVHGCERHPEQELFLEIDPELQPTYQNLIFMAELMSGGDPQHQPVVLDPGDLEIRGGRLYATKAGQERELKKVISRVVDVDLQAPPRGSRRPP